MTSKRRTPLLPRSFLIPQPRAGGSPARSMWSFRRILIFTRSIPGLTASLPKPNMRPQGCSRFIPVIGYRSAPRRCLIWRALEDEASAMRWAWRALPTLTWSGTRSLGSAPYVARAMLHQVFALNGKDEDAERTPTSLLTKVPERRLELRAGKMSLADYFDVNAVGSDSHLQFLNWTAVNNGAYDYAADTRGYTVAAMVGIPRPQVGACALLKR